jgi:hypothetical protein
MCPVWYLWRILTVTGFVMKLFLVSGATGRSWTELPTLRESDDIVWLWSWTVAAGAIDIDCGWGHFTAHRLSFVQDSVCCDVAVRGGDLVILERPWRSLSKMLDPRAVLGHGALPLGCCALDLPRDCVNICGDGAFS